MVGGAACYVVCDRCILLCIRYCAIILVFAYKPETLNPEP